MYDGVRAVLGPKRTLEILSVLDDAGTLNYTGIEERVPTSSDVVSDRLRVMGEYALVDRIDRSSRDVQYSITEKGRTVLQHADELELLLSGSQAS